MRTLSTKTLIPFVAIAMLSACSTPRPSATISDVPASPEPIASTPSPVPTVPGDPFTKGVDKAASATSLTQAAQTSEDWRLVVTQWQRAIAFMKAVPTLSTNHKAALTLLATYQQNLLRAQQQAKSGSPTRTATTTKADEGGIPLIAGAQPSASPDTAQEAVTAINTVLQQQTEFFAKQKRFAANLSELGSSIPADTANYAYSTSVGQFKQAIATATAKQDGLPSYTGAILTVKDEKNNDAAVSTVCLTNKPSKTPPAVPKVVGKEAQCPSGSTKL